MSTGPLQAREEDRFERPAPSGWSRDEGKGGSLKWGIAALALIAFGGSLWYAYQRGAQDAVGEVLPPLIKADPRPTKLRPDDPGGLKVPNRDKLVYERLVTDQPDKRVERLLPPPEAPVEKPAGAGEDMESPVAQEDGGAIPVGTTNVVPPRAVAPQKPPPTRSTTLTLSLDPTTGEARQPGAAAPDQAAAQATAPQAAGSPPLPLAPPMRGEENGETPTSAEASGASSGTVAPQAQIAALPRQGAYGVQLAALRDEAGAPNEWRRLQAAFGGVLGKLESEVVRADLGQRGIFYRLVAGRFSDEAAARAACAELRALEQDCLVVKLD